MDLLFFFYKDCLTLLFRIILLLSFFFADIRSMCLSETNKHLTWRTPLLLHRPTSAVESPICRLKKKKKGCVQWSCLFPEQSSSAQRGTMRSNTCFILSCGRSVWMRLFIYMVHQSDISFQRTDLGQFSVCHTMVTPLVFWYGINGMVIPLQWLKYQRLYALLHLLNANMSSWLKGMSGIKWWMCKTDRSPCLFWYLAAESSRPVPECHVGLFIGWCWNCT